MKNLYPVIPRKTKPHPTRKGRSLKRGTYRFRKGTKDTKHSSLQTSGVLLWNQEAWSAKYHVWSHWHIRTASGSSARGEVYCHIFCGLDKHSLDKVVCRRESNVWPPQKWGYQRNYSNQKSYLLSFNWDLVIKESFLLDIRVPNIWWRWVLQNFQRSHVVIKSWWITAVAHTVVQSLIVLPKRQPASPRKKFSQPIALS